MKYNELKVKSHKSAIRVGRGIAAGKGKTAGRGTKGQKSRAGWSLRPGFAGGQNPLMQQLPKLPGFKSYRQKAINVFTDQLQPLKENTIDTDVLTKTGLIRNPYLKVKLLNRGQLSRKILVKLPAASAAAIASIEKAGGTFEKVDRIGRQSKVKDETK